MKADYSHEVRHHESRLVRALYLGAGLVFVALVVVGIFLPVLPGVLLAALAIQRAFQGPPALSAALHD